MLCLACVLPGLPCHQGRAQVEGKGAGRRRGCDCAKREKFGKVESFKEASIRALLLATFCFNRGFNFIEKKIYDLGQAIARTCNMAVVVTNGVNFDKKRRRKNKTDLA